MAQQPVEHVEHHHGPRIAEMRAVIDRRPADIHPHVLGSSGVEDLFFHRSWVLLPYDADTDELRHRITASYSLIRGSLTKAAQAALPAYEG
jgi:hypothetical protein